MSAPLIIVGGGIAGLATALAAAPAPVLLLNRARSGAGAASGMAQGGIAAPIGGGDTPQAHARDTCEAGSHHNDREMVDLLTGDAVAAIDWLQRHDVVFDRNGDGTLQLGREGGHDRPRIVHAGGDATGAKVMEALVAATRRAPHIRRRADVDVDGLLLRGGRTCGVHALDADGNAEQIHGRAVVLATGGIGGLFARTSNPADADGNGLALALAAGAALRDIEFVQFHPTALALPGLHSLPLVTEALRGAGARLLDAEGKPLMAGVHPLADLAPRDVVARQVWQACRDGGTWLDARGIGTAFPARFPTVFGACMQHGIDPRLQPIPVTPAAHFHMGGIAVDADGRSSLPGLHAVGEVACNGVHGANRLASNSLLEGVVFGRRLGARLGDLPDTGHAHGECTLVRREPSLDAPRLAGLRELMMRAMGPVRSGGELRAALQERSALAADGWQATLAQAMVEAALHRTRSLGAHFRID
ncbi:fumarate reductase [Stenotrophomonas daejeonensis]|uniref:L-aspartate oxidase n=1 Tax=Stenotrophomonas daejeonensis TaxID=659018 RepID=A0A0R0DQK4_9GAMM|nr:FAD-binding protein [Stenotrophomonas daejeonensis]KRG83750.1 fumarate reductase [Stenotrophomonas daejeonensis]